MSVSLLNTAPYRTIVDQQKEKMSNFCTKSIYSETYVFMSEIYGFKILGGTMGSPMVPLCQPTPRTPLSSVSSFFLVLTFFSMAILQCTFKFC
jgi:hypothetical protein